MLSSPIGRGRFFLYSVVLSITEIMAVILCIASTIGIEGLAKSPPGPGREGLVLALLVALIPITLMRTNVAWRRGQDAQLSRWLILPYIAFSLCYVVLQALVVLTYDFDKGTGGDGLGLLGLTLMGTWCAIWLAKSKDGSFDPDTFLAKEGIVIPSQNGRAAWGNEKAGRFADGGFADEWATGAARSGAFRSNVADPTGRPVTFGKRRPS